MALEYDLFLSEPVPAGRLLRPLLPLPGLSLRVFPASPERDELLRESYGVAAKTMVAFRVDLSVYDAGKGYAGNLSLLRAAAALLKASGADAVLLFNGESPLLLRLNGRLVLNSAGGWWDDPDRLRLMDLPHEKKRLPSL